MSRYDDGSGYACDSEQEADWFDEPKEAVAYCFVELSEDGNGGLSARIRIFSERNPTSNDSHLFNLFNGIGSSYGRAELSVLGTLKAMFPNLRVSHG